MKGLIISAALVSGAMAQAGPYMQCGGKGFTGQTTCVSGYTCTVQNDFYSQCVQGSAGGVQAEAQATTLRTSTRRSCKSKPAHASDVAPHVPTTTSSSSSTSAPAVAVPSPKPVDTKPASTTPTHTAPVVIPAKPSAAPVKPSAPAVKPSAPAVKPTPTAAKPSSTSAAPSATKAPSSPAPVASAPATPGKSGKFKWFGINQSGAEFGAGALPGVLGQDYVFPDLNTITTLMNDGYTTFRISYLMERLSPSGLTGTFDAAYLSGLTKVVDHITSAGGYAVLDAHNYGRFDNNIITDTAGFKTYFTHLATQFKSYPNVIYDTNNEYNSMDQDLVLKLNQAAIDGIRAVVDNWIWVEGNSWTGAHSWTTVNDNIKGLTDPLNKTAIEMHQYLDNDSSGTAAECVSTTIGVERVKDATAWLRTNKKVGVLGEFAGGANAQCKEAVANLLDFLKDNSDVWIGASFWAAGPMWGSYMFSFEPETGIGYNYYNELLKTYQ
ncbi:endoglucanase 3 [Colletotrichum orchidophilum]|uniref:cellulase n=1 Tax=Colletotrichum orchidophilum TaxID=1209926 RepID=A0A1G4BQR6_9PEZI|nr:endoglucanase 3 [Colletotrichum orchidophilum]OHF03779.1 endoglucanase 3 [Colletotrichum orchidophilum]